MRTCRALTLFATSLLPAQVVVDASGGAGSQYTSLVAAVAAVPDGTTLLVRAGNYPGVITITSKGLTILADPGVALADSRITIQNTLATQANVLRGLAVASVPSGTLPSLPAIVLSNCQGRVVFEQCTVSYPTMWPTSGPGGSLAIGGCQQVALRACTLPTDTSLTNSNVVAEDCSFRGRDARFPGLSGSWPATAAIYLTGGAAQFVRCTIQGGRSDGPLGGCTPSLPNQPGLLMNGGSAVVRAPGQLGGGACGTPASAASGAGTLRIDPSVAVVGALVVSPPPAVLGMPTVRSTSAALNGTLSATTSAVPGSLLFLVLGRPGPPLNAPGFSDPFWVEPADHAYAAVGVGGPLSAALPVPSVPALRGVQLAWQAVAWDPAVGFAVSQPSLALVY